jgi:hypothetical protein
LEIGNRKSQSSIINQNQSANKLSVIYERCLPESVKICVNRVSEKIFKTAKQTQFQKPEKCPNSFSYRGLLKADG